MGSATYGMSLEWLQPMTWGRLNWTVIAEQALLRHGLATRIHTVEEYTYGIAVGITAYGPSLTQVSPVHSSDRPGFGSSTTSVAEGYGRTRQGSANIRGLNCTCPLHLREMVQQADTTNQAYSKTGFMRREPMGISSSMGTSSVAQPPTLQCLSAKHFASTPINSIVNVLRGESNVLTEWLTPSYLLRFAI